MFNKILFTTIFSTILFSCQYDENKGDTTNISTNDNTQNENITYATNNNQRDFEVTNFSKIEISSAFDVILTQGDFYKVTALGNNSELDKVVVKKSGDKLSISLKNHVSLKNNKIEIQITLPSLKELELSGAVSAKTSNAFNAQDLDLDLSGASNLNMQIDAQKISIENDGASEIQLSGKAQNLSLDLSGGGNANLQNLIVENAKVELSGASDAKINVNKSLEAEASGASSLEYNGNPQLKKVETSGASKIQKI